MGPKQKRVDMMASKDFPDKLVQTCPDGIIGIDRKGTVIIFNRAAEKLTGRAVEEIIGKVSIQAVYDSPEMAREIKKQIYGQDYGGPGRVEGLEVTVKNTGGNRAVLASEKIGV